MQQVKGITTDLYWIGGNDRRLALFENVFPIEGGVTYNSYFIDDEKTVVMDCVDKAVSEVFFENITYLLKGRKLDYVMILIIKCYFQPMRLEHSMPFMGRFLQTS